MPFESGNMEWKKRAKHGRVRIINNAKFLAEASDEYFKECVENPIIETDYRSVGGKLVKVELPHPKSFQKNELARFCGLSQWRSIDNLKKCSHDFMQVITRVEAIIADQKYKYAVVGMFSETIGSRD